MPKKALVKDRKKTSWGLKTDLKKLGRWTGLILAGVILIVLISWLVVNRQDEKSVVRAHDAIISVELADSDSERAQGLSGRESLSENEGMWFIFDKPGKHGIWMKDMKFPIDVIWVGENYNIISIRTLAPETYPDVFQPAQPAKYVLEVNAGFADKNNLKLGDQLQFQD